MTAPRTWMTLTIGTPTGAVAPSSAADSRFRSVTPADAESLAVLMLESYRGTVDDGGETLDDARNEVRKLFAGDFGTMDWGASMVAEEAGCLASATIVTRDRVAPAPLRAGEAFLAFSMTAPQHKRRGFARAGLLKLIEMLHTRGEPRLHLVVTRSNTPAVALYRSLGFVVGPIGTPPPSVYC